MPPHPAKTLTYDPTSMDPTLSLRLHTHVIPPLPTNPRNQVLLQLLAAPLNRVDQLVLHNAYPIKPHHTHSHLPIPGFDACARVLASTSSAYTPGDLVLPRTLGQGTWRTHAVFSSDDLVKVPRSTPPVGGALLRSGAVVARLLLEKSLGTGRSIGQGECILVSAGTSCVAAFLVQFARMRGVEVVLVVRGRENEEMKEVRKRMGCLGASAVMSEGELMAAVEGEGKLGGLTPVVALDCVFGRVGQVMLDLLAPGGRYVMVGMLGGTRESLRVGSRHLFGRQISLLPFRGSEELKVLGVNRVESLFVEIAEMMADGRLVIPEVEVVRWEGHDQDEVERKLKEAVARAEADEIGCKKTVWVFTE